MSKPVKIPLTARLYASLSAEGVVNPSLSSSGSYTMDPEIARERIRRSRFGNPVRYVLELVQAAVLKGASTLSFRFGADDMHLEFDGEPFAQSDFEQLYTSLLLKADGRAAQARQLLALGLCT